MWVHMRRRDHSRDRGKKEKSERNRQQNAIETARRLQAEPKGRRENEIKPFFNGKTPGLWKKSNSQGSKIAQEQALLRDLGVAHVMIPQQMLENDMHTKEEPE